MKSTVWIRAGFILSRLGRCLVFVENRDEASGHPQEKSAAVSWEKLAQLLTSLQKFSSNANRSIVQFREFDVVLESNGKIVVALLCQRGIALESVQMKASQALYTFHKLYSAQIQLILKEDKENAEKMLNEYTIQTELQAKKENKLSTMKEYENFATQYFNPLLATPPYDWFWLWYITSHEIVARALIIDSSCRVLISSVVSENPPFKQGLMTDSRSSIWNIISQNVKSLIESYSSGESAEAGTREKITRTLEFSPIDSSSALFVCLRMIRIPGGGCLVTYFTIKKASAPPINPGSLGFRIVNVEVVPANLLESIHGTARAISRHFPSAITSIPSVPHRPVGHKSLRQTIQQRQRDCNATIQTHTESSSSEMLLSPSKASFPYALLLDRPQNPTVVPLTRRSANSQVPSTTPKSARNPTQHQKRDKQAITDYADILEASFLQWDSPVLGLPKPSESSPVLDSIGTVPAAAKSRPKSKTKTNPTARDLNLEYGQNAEAETPPVTQIVPTLSPPPRPETRKPRPPMTPHPPLAPQPPKSSHPPPDSTKSGYNRTQRLRLQARASETSPTPPTESS